MYRSLVVFLLFISCALARQYTLTVENKKGCMATFSAGSKRVCVCLRNTQTHFIKNYNAGKLLLFRSSDCTGNYQSLATGKSTSNAEWVNSASFGPSSGSSIPPYECDDHMPTHPDCR